MLLLNWLHRTRPLQCASNFQIDDIFWCLHLLSSCTCFSFPYGASIVTFAEARTIMRRARDNCLPPTPLSLKAMHNSLTSPKWISWTLNPNSKDSTFFKCAVEVGRIALFFQAAHALNHLSGEVHLFIGFSKALPRHPPSLGGLLVIGVFIESEGQPMV